MRQWPTPDQRPQAAPPGLATPTQNPADAANAGRTRPVYPYPGMAVYSGHGDPRQASSYRRGELTGQGGVVQWAGSGFFAPYPFKAL